MTRIGDSRHHFKQTSSTNDRARELIDEGTPSGTIVTADEQTAGRGRHGRAWSAPAGSALLCSVVLSPVDHSHSLLPLAVPLAICEAVEAIAPVSCKIKWPNDVWLDDRKLAGILIEARPPDWAVIGIGLNLSIADDDFPPDLGWPATSLGHGVDSEQALAALCSALERWINASAGRVLGSYELRDALRGRQVTWGSENGNRGVARGVDRSGNLVVELPGGEQRAVGAGEVNLLRPVAR